MKKIIVLLGAIALIASSTATVISCGIPAALANQKVTKTSIAGLNFKIDIDDQTQNNFAYIEAEVESKIKKIAPLAKNKVDYQIPTTGFVGPNRASLVPQHVKVSALPTSKILERSFNVTIYKDVDQEIAKDPNFKTSGGFADSKSSFDKVTALLDEYKDYIKEGIDYTIQRGNGIWTVKSVGENSLVKINVTFTEDIQTFDLANLGAGLGIVNNEINVEQLTTAELKEQIKTEIEKKSPGAQELTDYVFKGYSDFEKGSEIDPDTAKGGTLFVVQSVTNNPVQRLTGSYIIKILKRDISQFKVEDISVLATQREVEEAVKNEFIKELTDSFTDKLVKDTDFKIELIKDSNSWKVSALKDSNYLTGEFSFNREKISLNQLNNVELNLVPWSTEIVIKQTVIDYINKNLLNNNQGLIIADDGKDVIITIDRVFVTVNATSDSLLFKSGSENFGTFKLTQEFNIGELSSDEFNREIIVNSKEQTYEQKLDAFLAAVNKKFTDNNPSYTKYTLDDFTIDDRSKKLTQAENIIIAVKTDETTKEENVAGITGTYTINVTPVDISGAKSLFTEPIKLAPKDEIKSEVQLKINNWINANTLSNTQVVLGQDFEIVDQNNNVITDQEFDPGNYTIRAITSDTTPKTITGSFEVIIEKYDMTGEKEFTVGSILIRDEAKKIIDSIAEDNSWMLTEDIDYKIIDETGNGTIANKSLTIRSTKNSTYLTGIYTIKLNPIDLTNLLGTDENTIIRTSKEIEVFKTKINTAITGQITNNLINPIYGVDYAFFDADNKQVDKNDESTNYSFPAGNYSLQGLNDNYFTGKLDFKVDPINWDELETLNNFEVGINQVNEISTVVQNWINANANLDEKSDYQLANGVDYQILENGIVSDLTKAGTKTIHLLKQTYLAGNDKTFEINKYNLTNHATDETDFAKEIASLAKEINVKLSLAEITGKIADVLNKVTSLNSIQYETDFKLNEVDEWSTNGIKVSAVDSSDYLTGEFSFNLTALDLQTLTAEINENSPILLNISYEQAKTYITDKMYAIFKDSIVRPKIDEQYIISGPATQTVDNKLVISGPAALTINSIADYSLFINKTNVEVPALKDPNDANKDINYEVSGNNYLLTPTRSAYLSDNTYGASSLINLDTLGYIRNDEILGISRYFLVTTRGVFLGPQFITGTDKLNLVYDDILSVTDSFVLTTKGSWYYNNVSAANASTWTYKEFSGPLFSGLTASDILAVPSENLIITSKGVYNAIRLSPDVNNIGYKTIVFSKVNIPELEENGISTLKENFIAASDGIIVTKIGTWTTPSALNGSAFKKANMIGNISSDDIFKLTNSYVAFKNIGIVDRETATLKENHLTTMPLPIGDEIIAKSNNYLVTTKKIYWQGKDVTGTSPDKSGSLTKEKIVGINDTFLVTTSRIYFKGGRIKKDISDSATETNFNFAQRDLYYMNDRFVVMKQGIHYEYSPKDWFGPAYSLTWKSVNLLKDDELYYDDADNIAGISNTFITIKAGVWWREAEAGHRIQWLGGITGAHFITANDYYWVSDERIWALLSDAETSTIPSLWNKKPNEPFLNKNQIIALKGPTLLVQNFNFYYYGQPYSGITGITKDDFIRIGNQGQIITKKKIWIRRDLAPIDL